MKNKFVIFFSIMGVIALLITIIAPSYTSILLCFIFFILAFLEEKTNLIVIKTISRVFFVFIIIFVVTFSFFILIEFTNIFKHKTTDAELLALVRGLGPGETDKSKLMEQDLTDKQGNKDPLEEKIPESDIEYTACKVKAIQIYQLNWMNSCNDIADSKIKKLDLCLLNNPGQNGELLCKNEVGSIDQSPTCLLPFGHSNPIEKQYFLDKEICLNNSIAKIKSSSHASPLIKQSE